jgi:nucleoside-diphosphate-sugar epimerase
MARPDALRVVVIGGYGYFGHRLVQRLTRQDGLHIIVAGRSLQQAQAVVATLRDGTRSPLEAAALDTSAADFAAQLRHLAPHAAVHASGPFQGQTYHVAQATSVRIASTWPTRVPTWPASAACTRLRAPPAWR